MQELKIDKNKARSLYPGASNEMKVIFEETFGKDFFSMSITEMVNGFDDILAISGRTMKSLVNDGDRPDEIAYKQAKLIAEVYNEGTVLKPGDNCYYPWHKIVKTDKHPSGFGLSYFDCDGWRTISGVGVRLCFKEHSLAIDAGKKFNDIYEILKIR